jgi:hypothetical protein
MQPISLKGHKTGRNGQECSIWLGTVPLAIFIFNFLDSTARKNIHKNLYKKQDYLFYTIIV